VEEEDAYYCPDCYERYVDEHENEDESEAM
jgi:hypothetical protein